MMLVLPGSVALSPFRIRKLESDISTAGLDARISDTRFIHLADVDGLLTPREKQLLNDLLRYGADGDERNTIGEIDELFRLVIPRRGTISPWSSKATDISKICGLDQVRRIERGIGYWMEGRDLDAVLPLIHDRMTGEVVHSTAVEFLFDSHEPRELNTINVLEEGSAALEAANRDLGMALTEDEIEALVEYLAGLQ